LDDKAVESNSVIRQLTLLVFAATLCLPAWAEEEASTTVSSPSTGEATPVSFDSPGYKRRPYLVSIFLRQEYDTNINTSEFDEQASFKTIAEPEIAINIPNSRTFLGTRYRNSTTYYWDRPGDAFDIAHYFDFVLNHEFTPRLSIDITENFRYAQEPELSTDTAFFRREGTYKQNSFHAGASYYLTRRLFWNVGFGHDWWQYDDPFFASFLDRTSYTGATGINFVVSPLTTTSLNYNYVDTIYSESPRDSVSHMLYAGLLQTMTPQWTFNLQGGAQHRKTEGAKADIAPFAAAETNWTFLPTSTLTVGYNTSLQDTDSASFNYSQTQHFYGTVNARLTYDLNLSVGGDYILNDYPGNQNVTGSTSDAQETTLVYRVSLSYMFTPQWSGEMGYSYSTVDSDFVGSSYDRSLASVGMRFTY
jgi:hypothetical protein